MTHLLSCIHNDEQTKNLWVAQNQLQLNFKTWSRLKRSNFLDKNLLCFNENYKIQTKVNICQVIIVKFCIPQMIPWQGVHSSGCLLHLDFHSQNHSESSYHYYLASGIYYLQQNLCCSVHFFHTRDVATHSKTWLIRDFHIPAKPCVKEGITEENRSQKALWLI